jgi:hypothetical protein
MLKIHDDKAQRHRGSLIVAGSPAFDPLLACPHALQRNNGPPDGWPQATTVGYVNEGLTLYFLCALDSQKAANLARDNRVSPTIDHDADQIMEITEVSMAAHAHPVVDRAEAERILQMIPLKYPKQVSMPGPMPDYLKTNAVTALYISLQDSDDANTLDIPPSWIPGSSSGMCARRPTVHADCALSERGAWRTRAASAGWRSPVLVCS